MKNAFWSQTTHIKAEAETPYQQMLSNISLLNSYIEEIPSDIRVTEDAQKHISQIDEILMMYARKPNVCLYGNFDSGKSTLSNILLGKHKLPTGLAPLTRIPTFIHHVEDRPKWLNENDYVLIFDENWDPVFWSDEDNCIQHLVEKGGYNALKEYVTHKKKKNTEYKSAYALVFVDAPVLLYCSITDFPGFGNSNEDTLRTTNRYLAVDVAFYLSILPGFMDATELYHLGDILDKLPNYPEIPSINQLFIVATHCNPRRYNTTSIKETLKIASKRICNQFDNKESFRKNNLTERKINQRIFACWFDDVNLDNFTNVFFDLIKNELPKIFLNRVNSKIDLFKQNSNKYFSDIINEYHEHLADFQKVESFYNELVLKEPERKRQTDEKKKSIIALIKTDKKKSIDEFCLYYDNIVSIESIIGIIENKFPDKKEAQTYLSGYIIELLQEKVKSIIDVKTNCICSDIENYISGYHKYLTSQKMTSLIPFDATRAFSIGLSNASSLGAISFVSGIYRTGILTALTASLISSIGMTAASVFTTLGAILTPLAPIALGIIALGIFSLFKDWKKELAKEVYNTLLKKDIKSVTKDSIYSYWEDTETTFISGAERIELEWSNSLHKKGLDIKNKSIKRVDINNLLKEKKQLKSYFDKAPWEKSNFNI
ncbi:phage holin family protein [Bacteroides faecium]|uniref:Dynamin N-terminal domain-containing protein n=1 Tax=Bacteroides faecium TaxID=2715212 RepID=A0A6H0KMK1_9BACE|nr:phage holin family protein [Bacteroides faecium]QIU94261.1 hypothetical protein BacF7301_08910 [Bacteroides faecium]